MKTAELYEIFKCCRNVCTDSRGVVPGSLFFALRGERFNGNMFAAEALERGAAFAVVDDPAVAGQGPAASRKRQFLPVEDVLGSLQDLAAFHRGELGIPVLAVTGSNGKTTTKELITACLMKACRVHATSGNLNNHIGVPLSLLAIRPGHEMAVIEMGASHPGEIALLCRIADPDYGIITNIGKAHLEGFGSPDRVRKSKGELYDHLGRRGKAVFVNRGDEMLVEMCGRYSLERVFYGDGPGTRVSARVTGKDPYLTFGLCFGCKEGSFMPVKTKVFGSFNLQNFLAAACIADYFGVGHEQILKALEAYRPGNMRSQVLQQGSNTVVLDTYNANPGSMKAAIEDFPGFGKAPKVLILGEMLELGDYSLEEHTGLIRELEGKDFRTVCLVGRIFRKVDAPTGYLVFDTTGDLEKHLKQQKIRDSAILVKGSRLMALERILPLLRD